MKHSEWWSGATFTLGAVFIFAGVTMLMQEKSTYGMIGIALCVISVLCYKALRSVSSGGD